MRIKLVDSDSNERSVAIIKPGNKPKPTNYKDDNVSKVKKPSKKVNKPFKKESKSEADLDADLDSYGKN